MKIDEIGHFLSQSEAAILYCLAEKVMIEVEICLKHAEDEEGKPSSNRKNSLYDAQNAAHILKCLAEQSILNNDGKLFSWIKKTKESKELQDWLELEKIDEKEA